MRKLTSKGVQDSADLLFVLPAAAARCGGDGLHLAAGALQVVVYYDEIVIAEALHLLPGPFEASRDFFLRILPPGTYAVLELLPGGRHDEDSHRLRELLLHLLRALHINFQHKVLIRAPRLLEPLPRRPVPVPAEHPGVLEELSLLNHALEFRFRNEIIPFPAAFGGARVSRGARD